MYAILKGYKFSVGKFIENSILSYYKGGSRGLVPYLTLIIRPCIFFLRGGGGGGGGGGVVEGDLEEE